MYRFKLVGLDTYIYVCFRYYIYYMRYYEYLYVAIARTYHIN